MSFRFIFLYIRYFHEYSEQKSYRCFVALERAVVDVDRRFFGTNGTAALEYSKKRYVMSGRAEMEENSKKNQNIHSITFVKLTP